MNDLIPTATPSDRVDIPASLAQLATSLQNLVGDLMAVRQAHSYVWEDAQARAEEIDMIPGSTGIQMDEGTEWTTYDGNEWKLTGGRVPFIKVGSSGTQTVTPLNEVILTNWAEPEIHRGFGGWASGVLTIAQPGMYFITASAFVDQEFGEITLEINEIPVVSQKTSGGQVLSGQFALQKGDKINLFAWQQADYDLEVSLFPRRQHLAVQYVSPL